MTQFLYLINRILKKPSKLLTKARLEIPGIVNKIKKSETIPRVLLGAGYNLINNKYDVGSKNLKGLWLTLINNEIEDIMQVILVLRT